MYGCMDWSAVHKKRKIGNRNYLKFIYLSDDKMNDCVNEWINVMTQE